MPVAQIVSITSARRSCRRRRWYSSWSVPLRFSETACAAYAESASSPAIPPKVTKLSAASHRVHSCWAVTLSATFPSMRSSLFTERRPLQECQKRYTSLKLFLLCPFALLFLCRCCSNARISCSCLLFLAAFSDLPFVLSYIVPFPVTSITYLRQMDFLSSVETENIAVLCMRRFPGDSGTTRAKHP